MKHVPKNPPTGIYRLPASESRALLPATPKNNAGSNWSRALLAASIASVCFSLPAAAQLAAWDFTGEATVTTSTAEIYAANLDSTNLLTRGAGALASAGSNSFRTVGFQNNGIATTNTDYFETTLSAAPGFTLSLTTLDARFAGTTSFSASPGVSGQFAYSLDGTNFTLIGTPFAQIGNGAMLPIDLSGVSALQVVPDTTTVTIRFYASGQTTTGGWGFNSPSSGQYGFAIGGAVAVVGAAPLSLGATTTTFAENAGTAVSTGTITIPAILATDLTITLESSDPSEATVPSSVIVTAGNTSATFPIDAVNDLLADGSQNVVITASSAGYIPAQVSLTVEDDTDAPISVSVLPSSFAENAGPGASTGTITIADNTPVDLTINLVSTDISEATVPTSVVILQNTNTIDFLIDAQDDPDVDGTRTLSIQASATGYTGGSAQIQVTDVGDTAPEPTLPVNAIAFTGYNSDGDDDLAFVALVPIAEGDVILFSDNEWNGSAIGSGGGFVDTNEGIMTWTAPAGGVPAGKIVTLNNLGLVTRSASEGTLTASNFVLAAGGDTVYAFQGALLSPTRVLAAISANTDVITNTGLTDHVVLPLGADIGAYTGPRNNQATFAAYLPQFHDEAANWITQDTSSFNDHIDTVEPDVPFSTVAFTLGTPGNTFATWIAGYPAVGLLTGPNDDFDNDGLDNAVENILGSNPAVSNVGLSTVSGTATSVTFRHDRADTPATDLTASYEWSTDLATWYPSGAGGGVTVTIGAPAVITDGSPNDLVEVTASVTSGTASTLFVRLKVTNP